MKRKFLRGKTNLLGLFAGLLLTLISSLIIGMTGCATTPLPTVGPQAFYTITPVKSSAENPESNNQPYPLTIVAHPELTSGLKASAVAVSTTSSPNATSTTQSTVSLPGLTLTPTTTIENGNITPVSAQIGGEQKSSGHHKNPRGNQGKTHSGSPNPSGDKSPAGKATPEQHPPGMFFVISTKSHKFYYCYSDPAWTNLAPAHRQWFATEAALKLAHPQAVQHAAC